MKMDSNKYNIISKNKRLFILFRWSGILIEGDDMKWFGSLFISRLCWFLWHVLGTGLSIAISLNSDEINNSINGYNGYIVPKENMTEMTNSPNGYNEYERFYVYTPMILILILFVGPIQGNIIKVNMEKFPNILKNLQKLDEMKVTKSINSDEDNNEDTNTKLQNMDLDSAENGKPQRSISVHEKRCTNCYTKNWLPNISVYIFLIIIAVSIMIVIFKLHNLDDLKDEYKLCAIMFYLLSPILTSLFVVTLINEITRHYEIVYNLSDRMFTESKNIEIVSNYLGLLQKTVDTIVSDIFEFTLGINFAIFVVSTLMCLYELIEGLKQTEKGDDGRRNFVKDFGEIEYIIPLLVCLFFMFWICINTDDLVSTSHHLQLKVRCLLPQLYLQHYEDRAPKGWSDKPFWKLEFLYKTLLKWPPQVYIYGGWEVNYQLLSAIVLFVGAYARVSFS